MTRIRRYGHSTYKLWFLDIYPIFIKGNLFKIRMSFGISDIKLLTETKHLVAANTIVVWSLLGKDFTDFIIIVSPFLSLF